jgi:hypothetical protein
VSDEVPKEHFKSCFVKKFEKINKRSGIAVENKKNIAKSNRHRAVSFRI